jgi:DNA polymerase-3 subunit beta
MKLSIPQAEFQHALSRIQAIVEKRSSMPILANVLLDAISESGEQTLRLSATDLEVGIRSSHEATVINPGSLTVSAKKLFEIVRELPNDVIHLEATSNSYLEIRCARSRFTLAGTVAEEYPTLPEAAPGKTVAIPASVLSQMIERTMYATSTDETRYNLNGVYLELLPKTGKIRMVATDGHRLAYIDRVINDEAGAIHNSVIIPRKALAELKRLVDEDDADELELCFDGNSGLVKKGGVILVMRLIEGEFPNYRQVLPKETTHRIVLSAEELSNSIRRVALLSSERSRAIRLDFSPGSMIASSNNPDLGEAQEELDIAYEGAPFSIGFNARYLLDALAVVKAKEIELGLHDELSPVQIRPTDDTDTLAVVMPMRL